MHEAVDHPSIGAEEASGEEIAAWLEAARAERAADLGKGLALARRAWAAAAAQGYLAEQLEAGRLRVFFLFRRGELPELLSTGQQLLALLREQGSSPALCELLRTLALAAAELGEFELALGSANESLARARELADPRLAAVAMNAVGVCFERMGDPWQAERLMLAASALVGDQATDHERMVTHNNLATVALGIFHLLRDSGHPRECAEALDRALTHEQAVRPHAMALGEPYPLALTDGNHGEVLLHLGRLDEAEALLLGALELDQRHGFLTLARRVRCTLAELDLARGRPAEALMALQTLLAESGTRLPNALGLRLHHAAYAAAKALGDAPLALSHLEQYKGLKHRRGVSQLMAQARYFVSRLEAEQGAALAGTPRAAVDQSQHDPLTGLGNHHLLAARMPALMRTAEQDGAALTLALIDVDRFQAINEQHGAAVGDRVLQTLAQMLRDNTRSRDLLLRWAGEEFLAVLPDTPADRAFEVCERLREVVEAYAWSQLSEGLDVTLSIGLANAPPYTTDLLIARAESAMQRAKHLGRNRVALA